MVGSHQFALFKCSDICAEKAKKGGGKVQGLGEVLRATVYSTERVRKGN